MRPDLLARLAAGATLVTPNRRLAQHFKDQFDAAQRAAGLAVWPSADVLPWPAFVARCFEGIAAERDDAPVLLSAEQAAVLWDQAIARAAVEAGLLSVAQTAAQCAEAWSLAHAWRLWPRMKSVPLSDDARAFAAWADVYEAQCRRSGAIDAARLADWIGSRLATEGWQRPARIVLAGFELRTAAQSALLAAFAQAGSHVEAVALDDASGATARVACADANAEIAAAARWAHARLIARPDSRIGVVVPDLGARREEVLRIFASVMRTSALSGDDSLAAADVSLGAALAAWPLVHDALRLLDAARERPLPFADWSLIVQSPFIGGAVEEASARGTLDAALREICFAEETLAGVRHAMARTRAPAPLLAARLGAFAEAARGASALRVPPSEWGQRFTEWLKAAGFPGERTLNSIEHQTLARLRALLEDLSALDRVLPRITLNDALARVRRLAGETTFQPEQRALPVQVLGILESAGIGFDHLWVTGLTANAWPLAARPHPFLPVLSQREAGMPDASPAAALAVDRRITAGWMAAAPEVVFSHAAREGERELIASPLIASVPLVALSDIAPAREQSAAERMLAARRMETRVDETAPALTFTGPLRAGAAVLRDQAACPFRATARHRLRAKALDEPTPGLTAMQRGTLLHAVLQCLWMPPADQHAVLQRSDESLAEWVRDTVASVMAEHRDAMPLRATPRLAHIESARLARLVTLWLAVEKARAPFKVEVAEQRREVMAGRLPLSVRLDRMDRLTDGALAGRALVIDYKAGKSSVAGWAGMRPDEPQLPLYLLSDADDVAALAFAQVRQGEMGFKGLGAAEGVAPGIRTPDRIDGETAAAAWQRCVDEWREAISALGNQFLDGYAAVDPKSPMSCEQCDLHRLCRIADRVADADEADEVEP
ncbi:MAG: PD-(D/E)XK nuclease family protein [Betaproteobacteria bacterium]|nr:PD-(D/E)XK nuclease family protein [Betaproteobacteria bacterium]